MSFDVDTGRNWSPFLLQHVRGGQIVKKFSDHLGIKMEIKITKADETKQAKREIIDYNNEEGWLTYKNHSDEIADVIKKTALNGELNIDEVREKLGRGVDGAQDDWAFCWFVELVRLGGGEGLEYLGLRRAVSGVTWVDSLGC